MNQNLLRGRSLLADGSQDALSPYEKVHGADTYHGDQFVFGQLVFFKPANTITTQAKTDPRLVPGIFLDYYVPPDGRFTGQYMACDLSDFIGKSLHHRVGPEEFKLHVHRTEVVREPPNSRGRTFFPLLKKYYWANYALAGLDDPAGSAVDNSSLDVEKLQDAAPL